MLVREEAECIEACEGEEAINILVKETSHNRPIDLILLDCIMPGMDGYTAASTIRSLNYMMPIVALTASSLESDLEKCLKTGFTSYLVKPVHNQVLIQTLQKYLSNQTSDPH